MTLRTYETVLYALDLEAVRPFYAEVLGLTDISRGLPRGLSFRVDERSVLLIFDPRLTALPHDLVPSHGADGPMHIAFRVDPGTLADWRTKLVGAGYPIEREVEWPTGARSVYVRDPAGHSVELVEGEIWPGGSEMTPPSTKPEWYAPDGLRFECTQCGACCTGPEGYVGVTDEECEAIAKLRNMPVGEFKKQYTRLTDDGRSLTEVRTYHGFDCVFLDRDTIPGKAVCGIYHARPVQCRTFPWWPGVLKSRAAWERLARECEGVGRGDFVPISEIRINRDAQAKRDSNVSR